MTVSTIYKLLDKLEIMIEKGLPIPPTPWVIVDRNKIFDVLDRIITSIPAEIQEAHGIIKNRDEIQLDAQRKANQILADAKHQAESLLSESELLKAVQSEAERIRQQVISDCEIMKKQAYEEAESTKSSAINESISIREGADRYAEAVLSNLDQDLTELHNIVRNGQKQLAKIKAESVSTMTAQRSKLSVNNLAAQISNQKTVL